MKMLKKIVFCATACIAVCACAGNGKAAPAGQEIAVFIPGALSGSPTYELLAQGVRGAAENGGIPVTVIEAGFNQAEWETKLTAAAASGKYRLIVSSNPSMPEIAAAVAAKFPAVRYMIFDGELAGNEAVYTLQYDKGAQAYALGFFAALQTADMGGGEAIGLVTAQHYPVMDEIILPAYLAGAEAARPGSRVDFRIVGHWSNPEKALELAADMIANGVKVILTIAGGGNEGVVQAAATGNAKVLWFDTNAYAYRPGVIAACCATYQDTAAASRVARFLEGKLPFGEAETVGFADGYVDFIDDDPLYLSTVSEEVRTRQAALLAVLRKTGRPPAP
jgi:simple sugar transport system substrate-binding protein